MRDRNIAFSRTIKRGLFPCRVIRSAVPRGNRGSRDDSSSIRVYDNEGIHWAFIKNVCMDMHSLELHIFNSKKSASLGRMTGFQHRWRFRESIDAFPPSSHTLFNETGAWMIIPGWLKHTSHFTENAIMVNHHASNPAVLPPVPLHCLVDRRCVTCFSPSFTERTRLSGRRGLSPFCRKRIRS